MLSKQLNYDLFQKASCKAISESKLTSNSNVSIITYGLVGQYQFKYIMKATQDNNTAAYSKVERSIKALASQMNNDDLSEATCLICCAAFGHNKDNVSGAPLALYLT
jgi:hypothetical protein